MSRLNLIGREVEVYRNLIKGGFSVRDRKTKKVLCVVDGISLVGVSFHVQEGSRQRVLREQRKNVHAFVRGTITRSFLDGLTKRFNYDPYLFGFFHNKRSMSPLKIARYVTLSEEGNFYAI